VFYFLRDHHTAIVFYVPTCDSQDFFTHTCHVLVWVFWGVGELFYLYRRSPNV
jgi:hypothetical protein